MSNPSHPIWSLRRLAIYMIALVATLLFNANTFDATEVKTIITMFVVASGTEGVTQFVRSVKRDDA